MIESHRKCQENHLVVIDHDPQDLVVLPAAWLSYCTYKQMLIMMLKKALKINVNAVMYPAM